MRKFITKNKVLELEVLAASDIRDCCAEAIQISRLLNCRVVFTFNGILVRATKNSDLDGLVLRWREDLDA